MTSLEDVVKFFNSYLDIDYAGNTAVYSESDEVLNERRDTSMKFWHAAPGILLSPGFGRPMGMPAEQLAQLAENVNLAHRELFLVAEYSDPTWGTLYAGYIGGDRERTAQSYGGLLYATEIKGELKIIASYREDIDKVSPPVHWRHSQGAEITSPNTPVAVRPLEAPTGRAAHHQDWEMLRNAADDR
ncbi:hypothetical protein [Streptomyces sp. Ncost-T10-10d]|uniref:hypothetical protein n=1 Tax=Streptomyces sp. Ncost-T10-10d TaxID=1839774 RepID=UPI00081E3A74|nr:hypothetical protein [Streptomyces sp. Ncost-T10-10d]SCF96038.1 hypothetical protein GA0115254_127737 [Streptomyces sp. Ncost-T10-10d]